MKCLSEITNKIEVQGITLLDYTITIYILKL